MQLTMKKSEIPAHLQKYFTAKNPRYKPGDLVNVPHMVAEALQSDGWVLRQDIIWSKPSPMPESVTNRCTKAHEYIFLLTKGTKYFYDAEAIKEKSLRAGDIPGGDYVGINKPGDVFGQRKMADGTPVNSHPVPEYRNKRSVWTVANGGYAGSHFATYPPKLIEPCILAGTSAHGCCAKCGAPFIRIVEIAKTMGWQSGCKCGAPVVPCTVLDPFIGSGTTCCVSALQGRRSIGIDLSKTYLEQNAIPRITGALWSLPAIAKLLQKPTAKVTGGVRCA